MATQVFKDGEHQFVNPFHIDSFIKTGWSLTPEEDKAPTKEEADTNSTGKLSSEEVRAAAKKANIEGWETKRINTLKAELGYDD